MAAIQADVESALDETEYLPGFADFSHFIASDHSLSIYRKFAVLGARNLLYLQDEICELEERLDALDQGDLQSRNDIALYSLHLRRNDSNKERRAIFGKTLLYWLTLDRKGLHMHSKYLQVEEIRDMYLESVRNWVHGKKPTIEESHFLGD